MGFDVITYALLKSYIDEHGGGGGGTTNYNSLSNLPKINSVELIGNKTATELGFTNVAITGSYADLIDRPEIPAKLSELQNDVGFILNTVDNLINYYKKSETYDKTEVNDLIGNLAVITVEIVETLPTTNISENAIYLVKIEDTNTYKQWMYINGTWADLGSTEINLENYYTKAQVDNLLNNKVDKIAGMGLSEENFTSLEKTKLNGLNNYELPVASTILLGGVKPDGTTVTVDSDGKLSVVSSPQTSEINDDIVSSSTTWSSNKISDEIETVSEVVNDINIAQKTVNKRGIKELLNQESIFSMSVATTNGTASETLVDKTIDLIGSIEDYDFLQIYAKVNSTSRKLNYDATTITLPIVYNDSNTINLQDNSVVYIICSQGSSAVGAFGAFHFVLTAWFKSPTQLYIRSVFNPLTSVDYNAFSISSIKGVQLDSVTIDPVEYVNTNSGIEDTPVGHILSLMGKTAPDHYLICDGTIYNISDYPYLSQYIKDQFGSFNFFGGNGTTTFAVPDLRGEFLRGTGTATRNTGSGESVGIHQDGTLIPNVYNVGESIQVNTGAVTSEYDGVERTDTATTRLNYVKVNATQTSSASNAPAKYTVRPTNTAVLYCIKYEPTYFMNIQGLIEETVLWEGSTICTCLESQYNSLNQDITLIDNIFNYDKIAFWYSWYRSSDGLVMGFETKEFQTQYLKVGTTNDRVFMDIYYAFTMALSMAFTSNNTIRLLNTYGHNLNETSGTGIKFSKIVGIKYKTFPTGGN